MRAYSIFLFLLLFGLCSSVIDEMHITNVDSAFTTPSSQTALIEEITNTTNPAAQEDTNGLYYVTIITWKGAVVFGKTLVYTITIIPLFVKLGVPLAITTLVQVMQGILIFVGLISWITQRSTKQVD
jgi:hypothetical protein